MGYNFRLVERDQQYLLPPSIRDWLPEDDLAWFVLDVVAGLDLAPIRSRYRADGWGAPAFDPALMTALLLYAYAVGERSSRRIEAACRRDLGFRVVTANQVPDHATIARFRADHEATLAGLFGDVLRLCRAAGLGSLGLVAIDGTKLAANAAERANRPADELDAEIARILAEHAAADAAEDAAHGPDRRGDELPPELADRRTRLARLAEARQQLAEAAGAAPARPVDAGPGEPSPSPDEAARPARATPRGWAERNTTDPDSRKMLGPGGWVQGYNAQLAVSEDGIVLAAGLTQAANDVNQLGPLLAAVRTNLAATGRPGRIRTVVADAGYWSEANLAYDRPAGPRLLIAPDHGRRRGSRNLGKPGRVRMLRRLARRRDRQRYRRRAAIVEPVIGQIKEIRRVRRFARRGLAACEREWTFVCITHNLLKLWRHRRSPGPHGPASRAARSSSRSSDRPTITWR